MSNDKELLQLAAKAAGYSIDFNDVVPFGDCPYYFNDGDLNAGGGDFWNPLDDDGDALRLAVKLKLSIRCNRANSTVIGYFREEQLGEPHRNDPYAATRRAIVRAAAEIGKTL